MPGGEVCEQTDELRNRPRSKGNDVGRSLSDSVLITSDDGAWTPPGASVNQKDALEAQTKIITELGFRSVWLEATG